MAEIALAGITKRFGRTTAVEGIDLTVADGEFFVLLGPTGAGKTTTLRLVAGLERPDAGTVSIGGVDARGRAPADRDVAFVFQHYSLYPHLTVFDNLAFPLRAPGKRFSPEAIRERVEVVAGRLRIDHKLKNQATRLSGGEMQRVSIGRALVREPVAFLMDEPLSSLDAKLREELRIELKHLQVELGATILYVTHDQVEAMTLADRVGVLIDGRLRQVGPPDAVYERPVDTAVAVQVGALPVNLLPAAHVGLADSAIAMVGVRPEHMVACDPASAGRGEAVGRVDRIERLGAEDVITVSWEGLKLHAAQPPALTDGVSEMAAIRIEPAGVMLFGADGRRLPDDLSRPLGLAPPDPVPPSALAALLAGGSTAVVAENATA